jgi:nucleoid DNA-binding protein
LKAKPQTVYKKEFIELWKTKNETTVCLTARQWDQLYSSFIDVIESSVKDGKQVRMWKFGVFRTTTVGERKIKHPTTKQDMYFPQSNLFRFRASQAAKDKLNETEKTTE